MGRKVRKRVLVSIIATVCVAFSLFVTPVRAAAGESAPVEVDSLESLTAAMNNADVSAIKLMGDIEAPRDSEANFEISRSIVLDLYGHKITVKSKPTKTLFFINSNGSLTVKDSSENKQGTISASGSLDGALIVVNNGGEFILENGKLETPYMSAVFTMSGGTAVINDGNIESEYSKCICAFEGSRIDVRGGKIFNGTNDRAYPVFLVKDGAAVNISGGTIQRKNFSDIKRVDDSALTVETGGTVNMTGGEIINSGMDGSVVLVKGVMNISGGTVKNTGNNIKNVVDINRGTVNLSENGSIENVSTGRIYGSVVSVGYGEFNMAGGTVIQKSTGSGYDSYGAVSIAAGCAGKVVISGGEIDSEEIAINGGNQGDREEEEKLSTVRISGVTINSKGAAFDGNTVNIVIAPEKAGDVVINSATGITNEDIDKFSGTVFKVDGGTFSHDVSKYVAEGKKEIKTDETGNATPYYVGNDADKIIAEVVSGDEITVIKADGPLQVPEGVIVDNQTGDKITVNNKPIEAGAAPQPAGHTLSKVEGTAATCTTEGTKTYYTCATCDGWFLDEEGTQIITDKSSVNIPVTAHTFEWKTDKQATAAQKGLKHEECTVCGLKKATVEIPVLASADSAKSAKAAAQTGDSFDMTMVFILMLISAAGITGIICSRRRCQ